MKICAIICEYNPFHYGHAYQLTQAKRLSGADAILCIMSGNFVQRGEAAIMEKYVRAKHAILAGADAVIELPTPFATSNAELFAKGAIRLISSIPSVTHLCFGAESADKLAFYSAARYLKDEPKEVSQKIKELVSHGASYAKARAEGFAGFIPLSLLTAPNNVLGLEYTKALLEFSSEIEILPIERIGGQYNDKRLQENFSSASAIRAAIQAGVLPSGHAPRFVLDDLPQKINTQLELLEKYAILAYGAEKIAAVCDCTEGLENGFIKAAQLSEPLTETLTSARYTSSRIRRIALQNLLKIDEKLIRESLSSPLYLRVLATNETRTDVLSALSESKYPLIVRAHDEERLNESAKKCFEKDEFAEKIYHLLYKPQKKKKIFIGKDK